MARRIVRYAIAPVVSLALLAGVGAELLHRPQAADAEAYHQQVRLAVAMIPMHIGAWVATNLPVPREAQGLLHPNALLHRSYYNAQTGQRVALLLVQCRNARDMVGHYPPVCYPNQGWTCATSKHVEVRAGALRLPVVEYEFHMDQFGDRATHLWVYNVMALPDSTLVPTIEQVNRAAADYTQHFFGAAQTAVCFCLGRANVAAAIGDRERVGHGPGGNPQRYRLGGVTMNELSRAIPVQAVPLPLDSSILGQPLSGMAPPPPQHEQVHLLRQLHKLLRGRYHWAVGLGLAGLMIGAVIGHFALSVTYESLGQIKIEPTLPVILVHTEQSNMLPMFEAYMDAQVDMIKSRRVIQMAMAKEVWKSRHPDQSVDARQEFHSQLVGGASARQPDHQRHFHRPGARGQRRRGAGGGRLLHGFAGRVRRGEREDASGSSADAA